MSGQNRSNIKKILERFYAEYNFRERLAHDPIEFPHRYSDPGDIEVVGFIAASLAYGKVGLFKPVIEKILEPCGKRPAEFIMNFSMKRDAGYMKGISYRFNREEDIVCLVYMLSCVLKEWGTLKKLFSNFYKDEDIDIRKALAGFIGHFYEIDTSPVYGINIKPNGLKQLLSNPRKGSACKRMNLFLRWMVRTGDIDFGIWDNILPNKLIIPLDTHIAKISKCFGLTRRAFADWKMAEEITALLREFDPEDPLKYDFALCHHGISGLCSGKKNNSTCSECAFSSVKAPK
ncbi:MAG TPA: TIGR02757 family protein [Nitrospirae bacterium]|nr:TIGR02757 family protein [Nitrospirota bacterium]